MFKLIISLVQACLTSSCYPGIADRDASKVVYQRSFTALTPEQQDLILEVKPELTASTDINALSEDISSNVEGVNVKEVVDLPSYKAVVVQGTIRGNSLGQYSGYFVDSNPTDTESVGDRVFFDGHTTQILPSDTLSSENDTAGASSANGTMSTDNQTALLTWNQTLPYGLKRSTPINNRSPFCPNGTVLNIGSDSSLLDRLS